MFDFIYTETAIADHPRTKRIQARFPKATLVPCQRYTELFNRSVQNFRLQKQRPALILAEKHGRRTLPTPTGYGIGQPHNYYFSHSLNCIYDCRYCFLQGMYRSAHLVLFVNYEDFQQDIAATIGQHPPDSSCFFSGYDGDSLALEGVSGFAAEFLPFFAQHPSAVFELRTKSARIQPLLAHDPLPNVVTAFSLTPPALSRLEAGVPALVRRLQAASRLQKAGWPVGLRFDPLIYCADFEQHYADFFDQVFAALDPRRLHSVSLGPFRLPAAVFKTMQRLYPEEPLFAYGLTQEDGQVSYRPETALSMHDFCADHLLKHIAAETFYPCPSTTLDSTGHNSTAPISTTPSSTGPSSTGPSSTGPSSAPSETAP